MEASDWIAIVAAVIALVSLGLTFLERRDRKEQVTAESRDRGAQLRLLQAQVEAELADRQRQRRSHLGATADRIEGGVPGGHVDRHYFTVINAGPDSADELRLAAVTKSGTVVVADER